MELLSLEINKNENVEIIENIGIITSLGESDINIEINSEEGDNIKIRYYIKDPLNKKSHIDKIIGNITYLIKKSISEKSIEYFEENYFYFEEEQFEPIKDSIKEIIDNDIKIKVIIRNKLKEVFETTKNINLNGFIKFRLKFIIPYAEQVVEKCIDDYLMKKEYLDFINVIKYFSDTDNSKHDELNVLYNDDGLQLYDCNMKKLNYFMNMELSKDLEPENLYYNENIINIILNITPKRIKLHTKDENMDEVSKNTISVIKKLFGSKTEICKGCRFCNMLI